MSKLHNLQSTAAEGCVCVSVHQPMQDMSLNREIFANLVHAVLTGLSSDEIGCVLPQLHVIFHLSQQAYSTPDLLLMHVCQSHTWDMRYRARHGIFPAIFIFNRHVP